MRVFLLGAGASKAYDQSPSGLRMPIAKDFFETYDQTRVASDPWALIEGLVGYLQRDCGIADVHSYLRSGVDIEDLHSRIEQARDEAMATGNFLQWMLPSRAYNELLFLFTAVLNEIQNGPVSASHVRLVEVLGPEDVVVTFNWDTLLDRALAEHTTWKPDWGYGATPRKVFRGVWMDPDQYDIDAQSAPFIPLIKLHGSTNWLTSHTITDGHGKLVPSHDLDPGAFAVFEFEAGPYACHAGRYRGGYQPYSYGYYPPNLTDFPGRPAPDGRTIISFRPKVPWREEGEAGDEGLVSMPLIIPPVRNKSYEFFGDLFGGLWKSAEDALAVADQLVVIGYSFPNTDVQSDQLFRRAFRRRSFMPKVAILDPAPGRVGAKFEHDLGIASSHLRIDEAYFSADYDLSRLFA